MHATCSRWLQAVSLLCSSNSSLPKGSTAAVTEHQARGIGCKHKPALFPEKGSKNRFHASNSACNGCTQAALLHSGSQNQTHTFLKHMYSILTGQDSSQPAPTPIKQKVVQRFFWNPYHPLSPPPHLLCCWRHTSQHAPGTTAQSTTQRHSPPSLTAATLLQSSALSA